MNPLTNKDFVCEECHAYHGHCLCMKLGLTKPKYVCYYNRVLETKQGLIKDIRLSIKEVQSSKLPQDGKDLVEGSGLGIIRLIKDYFQIEEEEK